MSFFNEANRDAYSVSPDAVATGPRVGFLESWSVSWNEQVRASAMYGIEDQMWQFEDQNVKALRQAGVENIPFLSRESIGWFSDNLPGPVAGSNNYLDVAKFYEDGGDPAMSNKLQDYDKRIAELQEKFPELGLRTSREMWDATKGIAQEYESRAMNDRRTLGGNVGAFFGGAIASMNPNTDPFNFVTLGVGGVGETALMRILSQGAGQGAIEAVNQITGVQEQRRLLGLEHGFGDAISRIGSAAVGGAALQGVGEGVAFGVRRWFRSSPIDPAPRPDTTERPVMPDTRAVPRDVVPADDNIGGAKLAREPETYVNYLHERSPYSMSRSGRARTVLDLDYVTQRLDDWGGGEPWAVPPKTDTAIVSPRGDFIAPDVSRVVGRAQVDDLARQVDPETFAKYDALAERKRTYRRWIDELSGENNPALEQRLTELDEKIDGLLASIEGLSGRRAAKARKDIAALRAEKEEAVAAAPQSADVARVRQALMKDDEKMRDLAPLVSRAYARARNEWASGADERKAVLDMMRKGDTKLPDQQAEAARVVDAAKSLSDRAPTLREAYKVAGKVADDADAADIASAIVTENIKAMDEALETYRGQLDTLLATEKNGEIEVAGQKLNLDRDKVYMPNEDGVGGRELTIRQLVEENKMDEYEIEAITTCSLRKTS